VPQKILVVDDERHIVRLIQVNLERHGYRVVTAFDGNEALEVAKREKPDAIVLDIMMPFRDGFEVLKTIRAGKEGCEGIREVLVIILSQRTEDKYVFEGYHWDADMYLTKPFNPMELVTCVKRVIEQGRQRAS
jgi:two-component system alkaline phosphatase synthesis response regulator PhoP/two-component system response regulator VicR